MKFLLIQHRQIGDVLMCTPAVRNLRKHFPDSDITFIVEPFSYNAVKFNPNIDHFIIPSRKPGPIEFITLHWNVWRSHYDAVIDFFRNPKSAMLTWTTRAEKRISFSGKYRSYAYNIEGDEWHKDEYAAIQKLRLLEPLGIHEGSDCIPDFFVGEEQKKWADGLWDSLGFTNTDLVIAISPVSRKKYRVWPGTYYAQLCDHLIETHSAIILLTWGPGEERFIEPIVENMIHEPVTDYPMPDLLQLQAVFEKTDLFIGNNNGPRHMCVAAGTPTLGLFSKLNPAHWTPPNEPIHTVIQPDPITNEEGREVLLIENLKPEKAIRAADSVMDRLGL